MKKIILCLLVLFMCVGCEKSDFTKESLEPNEFINKMESLDYGVIDLDVKNDTYKEILNAANGNIHVTYYYFVGDRTARDFFLDTKESMEIYEKKELDKDGKVIMKPEVESKSFNNFSIYSIETPYNYRYLSKVNDTVILVYASADSITQAKLMIEKIGY